MDYYQSLIKLDPGQRVRKPNPYDIQNRLILPWTEKHKCYFFFHLRDVTGANRYVTCIALTVICGSRITWAESNWVDPCPREISKLSREISLDGPPRNFGVMVRRCWREIDLCQVRRNCHFFKAERISIPVREPATKECG